MAAVLVTGASGFAGGHLVDLLLKSGDAVTGWHRPGRLPSRQPPNVRWQAVDVLDRESVAKAILESRPDVVYHCAGAAHVAQSWSQNRNTLATNVLGTHYILESVRTAAPPHARVFVPGSSYVYRQSEAALSELDPIGPASPYALSKLAQEMTACRAFADDKQQVYLTRSFNHIGPRQEPSYAASGFARQIAMIEAGRMVPVISVGNLDAARDLTDVRDTVAAYRAIVERGKPGEIYNVCSGHAVKIRDVLERLVSMSQVAVDIRVDPERYRPSDNPLLLGDLARLRRDTGWTPAIGLDQTLADLLEYWRKGIE